jgi:hypothetical protein
LSEQQPLRSFYEIEIQHWLTNPDGMFRNGDMLFGERNQPQRTVRAKLGIRGFSIEMGDPIRYNMPGVNEDVGMVRKMLYDFDAMTVAITTYHVDNWVGRNVPPKAEPFSTKNIAVLNLPAFE